MLCFCFLPLCSHGLKEFYIGKTDNVNILKLLLSANDTIPKFMKPKELIKKSTKQIWLKWSLAFKILPLIILVAILKFLSHKFGFEILELNTLFTSLVAGTIFLIGFLISGVLSDYKESEKIPSDLAATIKSLFDDTYTIYKGKNSEPARQFLEFQKSFVNALMDWFYKKERTQTIFKKISHSV